MKYLYCSVCALLLALISAPAATAQDFIYEPINPNFGGNTFNYSSLLSAATAQDTFKDPDATQARPVEDPLANFAANLNRQILSQLTDRFISDQFGRGTVRAGNYSVGGYQIQVTPGSNGVVIVIADPSTGNQTTVTIPNLP
ncbi:curli production assembly/transport component CsgF [Hymenobacter psychrophilus]|uniref:Curli production assembly/transport component CsgF n=1 Tax=Hymenobacter psychrophilus TaxID=651662 RepID=A0A1H3AU30_9BACT|nr:curli production assembly/transport component CsgF [Hymenobacter psychrophilus]SDX33125.1 curli production assembly/transport component CsgF [Hymenobacter psychrophilus]